jgi:hypothetical protein
MPLVRDKDDPTIMAVTTPAVGEDREGECS